MITNSQVIRALSTVNDPDFKKDLVTLDMIKELEVLSDKIQFTIQLTTPACPLKEQIENDCRNAIATMVDKNITVIINFTAKVTTLRDVKAEILPNVKNIIVVASGKGGVGKSTVSVNLAIALSKTGAKVGLIDADIHGPSIPMMLGLQGEKPQLQKVEDKHKIVPLERYGIKVLSIGFLINEEQAVAWRGPMVTSALRQFLTDVIWGELDYLVIDLPPGTGDIHLTLAQTVPINGAVIVTTPQDIALADAKKAVAFFKMDAVKIPILGVVENMAYFTPAELPNNKYYIFGKGGGKTLCMLYNTVILGEIPLEQSIREGGDEGKPIVLNTETATSKAFQNLAQNVAQQIAINNVLIEENIAQ